MNDSIAATKEGEDMAWIAVHEEVFGKKLRGFRKKLGCSEAEALGILVALWLWARNNTDITGLLGNVDEEDIAIELKPRVTSTVDADAVVDALVEFEWLDKREDGIYVHDWYDWQSFWYSYLEKKQRDKERKHKERIARKESATSTEPTVPKAPELLSEPKPEEPPKPKAVKPKKPPKTEYAEAVKMYPEEREKLVNQYGESFTTKLIEELNNYKLSSGKSYKDDYRAILSWVVDRCEKKYPNLKAKPLPAEDMPFDPNINPFDSYT